MLPWTIFCASVGTIETSPKYFAIPPSSLNSLLFFDLKPLKFWSSCISTELFGHLVYFAHVVCIYAFFFGPCAVYLPGFTCFSFSSLYYTFLFSPIVCSVSSFSFLQSQAMDLYIFVVGQTTPNVTSTTVQWEVRSSVTYVFISSQSLFQWMNFII